MTYNKLLECEYVVGLPLGRNRETYAIGSRYPKILTSSDTVVCLASVSRLVTTILFGCWNKFEGRV